MKNVHLLDGINPKLQDFLFDLDKIVQRNFNSNGITLSSGIRTYSQQSYLYNNRINNPYPVSHPDSPNAHYSGNAIDVSMDEFKSKWFQFVPLVKKLLLKYPTITWGIDWKPSDPVHFQIKESKSILPFIILGFGLFFLLKSRKK